MCVCACVCACVCVCVCARVLKIKFCGAVCLAPMRKSALFACVLAEACILLGENTGAENDS